MSRHWLEEREHRSVRIFDWTVLVWFATLAAMADALNTVGFVKWFAARATASLANLSPVAIMLATVALFFVVRYLFASLTAHTAAVPEEAKITKLDLIA